MAKYLKDRKKRELSLEEIEHYRMVAKAIERMIEVQGEVDGVIGMRVRFYVAVLDFNINAKVNI